MATAPRTRHHVPPEVRITVAHPGSAPIDLTLSYPLDPDHDRLLHDLHDEGNVKGRIECRMHDDDPALRDMRSADGRLHGAWLYLARYPGDRQRLILKHWPNGPVAGSHAVPSRMTPEHRYRQEYIALRGQACGYEVELEKRLANGFRPDAVITGRYAMAAEVQLSQITAATVKRRTAKAAEHQITSTWFAGSKNPVWAFKAPHVETNERHGFEARTWTVATGPRFLEHEHCTPSARIECPDGRGWCGRWHSLWSPIAGLSVDDIVEQVPSGALVRLNTGTKQGVILTTPADRDAWLAEAGVVVPTPRQSREARSGLQHTQYAASRLRRRIEHDRPSEAVLAAAVELVEPPLHRPRPCPACRRESRAIVERRCLACRAGVA